MIYPYTKLRILGSDKDSKGKEFEQLMIKIVAMLGYPVIRERVHSTGMEIDFFAMNKEESSEIYCECKAHEEKISSNPLQLFIGKLDNIMTQRKRKGVSLKAYFFSISGFSGTALTFYEGVSDFTKKNTQLFDNYLILDLLKQSGILSFEKIEEIVKSATKFELGERYIVSYKTNLFVIQLLKIGGVEKNFIILTSNGHIVDKLLRDEIKELDDQLVNLNELDLQLFEKILIDLFDMEMKSSHDLSKNINENEDDVTIVCNELVLQGIIEEKNGKFGLVQGNEPLVKVITILDRKKNSLLKTNYYDQMVSEKFIELASNRLYISLEKEERTQLTNICRLFPSIARMLLTRHSDDFLNPLKQMVSEDLTQEEREKEERKVSAQSAKRLFDEIFQIVSKEYWHLDLLEKVNIKGIEYGGVLKICTDREKLVDLNPRGIYFISRASGTIKPGEYVTTDFLGIFDMATALMNLNDLEGAIGTFDKIDSKDDEFYYSISQFNKGVCLMKIGQFQQAISCFEKLTGSIEPNLLNQNIEKCLIALEEQLREFDKKMADLQSKKSALSDFLAAKRPNEVVGN